MVAASDVVFLGKVTKVLRSDLGLSKSPSDARVVELRLEVEVTDLLSGSTAQIPKKITYLVGRSSLSEAACKQKYQDMNFIFMGKVHPANLANGGSRVLVAFPPSGAEPVDISNTAEVMKEIARTRGISGPFEDKAGN